MKKQEIDKKIELDPRWYIKMDLKYLDVEEIINFKRYNYPNRGEPILEIGENLLYFLEKFTSIDWTKYCDVHKDWELHFLSFADDISLASDEFLLNNKDIIDKPSLLKREAYDILGLIDNFLDNYNGNLVHTGEYIRRDDLNFLAQFLLRLATRLENLEKIKTNKKPKN
jgi:hypothetical protein